MIIQPNEARELVNVWAAARISTKKYLRLFRGSRSVSAVQANPAATKTHLIATFSN